MRERAGKRERERERGSQVCPLVPRRSGRARNTKRKGEEGKAGRKTRVGGAQAEEGDIN